ncbi:DUF5330 domain-containing protein [Candidatus Liberibacter sp.]|uniref:DUF5330 domain-containing protein n=1 Tax=Candidatus Liberibacter sp. TaxID=34022 RepID=UPI0015F4C662|nr:DUF5330 domain-containing protein [Candidatus Liberibacter sp.]MBA5723873.1 DUF5330 domain-containing protein [Candidatus Liberibacter sp.]
MFFIAKKIFWLSLVLVILSTLYPGIPSETTEDYSKTEIQDVIAVTTGALGYAGNICHEKPEVCTLGTQVFSNFKNRALRGAKVAYEFIQSNLSAMEQSLEGKFGSEKMKNDLPFSP